MPSLWQSIAATMKNIANILGLMVLGLVSGCLEGPSRAPATSSTVLYRHHFLGTAYLARTTNTAHLPAIIATPASHELTDFTLQKLSGQVQGLWTKFLPGASTQGALVRPLLDDLLSAESYAETRGPLNRGESVFAIELNDERANLWRTNLASILGAWKLGKTKPLTVGEAKGWEIKRT